MAAEKKPKACKLIAWGAAKAVFVRKRSVCPECGAPAELAFNLLGGLGYAHKPQTKRGKR